MNTLSFIDLKDAASIGKYGSWVIGLVFIVSLLLLTLPLVLRRLTLRRVVRKIRRDLAKSGAGLGKEDARRIIVEVLKTKKWLKGPADKFERSWRAAVPRNRRKSLDSLPFQSFLEPERIVPWFANRRLAASIPGVLVALGILGTFLGLLFSLPAVGDMGNSAGTGALAEESGKLAELVSEVVDGLGLAFETSIWGIFLSIVFIFSDRIAGTSLERGVLKISDVVNEQFPVMRQAEIDRERFEYLYEANENIRTLGTDLATHLGSTLENQMKPAMQAIQGSVDRLVTFSADEQVDGLRTLVEGFTSSMNEALGDQFVELQEVLASTVQSQRNIGTGLEGFSSTIRDSAKVQHALIQETNRAASTLAGSLDRLELVSGLLRDAAEDVVRAGAQVEQSVGVATESQNAALESQKLLVEAVGVHSEAMVSARQELEQSWSKAVDQATGTIERIREATREFANGVSDQLVTSLGQFDGALAETVERFSGTLVQVDGSVGELPPAANAMRESAEVTSRMAGELRDAVASLNELVKGIVTENLLGATQAAERLQSVVAAAQASVKEMGGVGSELADRIEAITVISRDVLESREAARESTARLAPLAEQVAVMQPSLQSISSALDGNGGLKLLNQRLENLSSRIAEIQAVTEKASEPPPPRKPFWRS